MSIRTFRAAAWGALAVAGIMTLAGPSSGNDGAKLREAPARLDVREAGVGRLVPDVALTGLSGGEVRLSELMGEQGLVLAVHSVGCPVSKKFVPALKRLASDYGTKGVSFALINPMEHETADKVKAFLEQYELDLPYHLDPEMAVARQLGVNTTTEVFVLDRARSLAYRGALSDQYGVGYALDAPRIEYVREALEAVLAKRRPNVEATTAPGCDLDLEPTPVTSSGEDKVTYHNRISRIIQRNCQECHRPGESAPFDLVTYADVKGHRAMIRRVVEAGSMPPWFAGDDGHAFANDRSLSAADRSDLLAWLDNGLPEGDPADAPVPVSWVEGWQIGPPDRVLSLPLSIRIPAEGTVPYKYVTVSNKFDEDCWIESMEIRPTAPENVHHVLIFLEYPEDHPRAAEQPDYRGGQRGFFAGMVPGQTTTVFPPGYAKFVPGGARLRFQLHYTTSGVATKDKTRFGIRLADGPPLHEIKTLGVANPRFLIPPHDPNHKVEAVHSFRDPGRVLSLMPHMHLRGKSFRYELELPGGEKQVVLDVPEYDFNWQFVYEFQEPLEVPAGSRMRVTGWFDNSDRNPDNPDPGASVRFGEQTWEEMMIGYISWHPTR